MNDTDRLLTKVTPWLCLLIAAFAGYGVWRWEFAADDVVMFRNYTTVLADDQIATSWSRVFRDFVEVWGGNPYLEYYRPLITLSLALDWTLFGYDAGANATVNLLLHVASAVLVHRIALRVLPDKSAAALAALLFVSTPLAQENIAWAVGRCALANFFALSATLVFLRRWQAGARGRSLHIPVVALLVCALMSMESGMLWVLFPAVALFAASRLGTIEGPTGVGELVRLTRPHWLLAPIYVLFRIVVLGTLGGENAEHMLRALAEQHVMLPLSLLYEALMPSIREAVWMQGTDMQIVWHLLVLLPCALGLYWRLRREPVPGFGVAALALLAFWFLSRVPSVHLPIRENLDTSRLAYYSFPPLALILGMLFSYHRVALLCGFLVVLGSAVHLDFRIGERLAWSTNTVRAREMMLEEAISRRAIIAPGTDPVRTAAFAYVDQVAGISGAPGVHPGELPLVLYPPFVDQRIHGYTLHWLNRDQELASAAAIAEQLGGVFQIYGNDPRGEGPLKTPLPFSEMRAPRPVAGLEPQLVPVPFDPVPKLVLGTLWRRDPAHGDAEPVLVLIAGNESLVLPMVRDNWPPEAYLRLWTWRRLAGRNASYCFLIETRTDPADPGTTRARSELVIGGFNR